MVIGFVRGKDIVFSREKCVIHLTLGVILWKKTMKTHKKTRSASEFHEARNRDLVRAYKQAYQRKELTTSHDTIRAALAMPAERFYVSEERAVRVVNQWLSGHRPAKMLPMQRMMYEEIVRRVHHLRSKRQHERINHLVWEVIAQPAPRFYLTEKSAYVILCGRVKK